MVSRAGSKRRALFFFDEETNETKELPMENLPAEVAQDEFEFFNENIRYAWHKQEEAWYFSIVAA